MASTPSPVQCNNSTAISFPNKTMVNKMLKSMDMRLWWVRCRYSQYHFSYYWAPGNQNLADYSTKHHPPLYHFFPTVQLIQGKQVMTQLTARVYCSLCPKTHRA